MRYRSNLSAPDLAPFFKLKDPALQIQGHDAPSDPDFEPGCTWWTHDEAAILYSVARQVGGDWVDLGARLGWTAAHVIEAGGRVTVVDQELRYKSFLARFEQNLGNWWPGIEAMEHRQAQEFLVRSDELDDEYHGFVIDADHDRPQPTLDAIGCHRIAKPDAVILMHDFMGRPIQEAVCVLMALGWRCRIYDTPNGVALLWRGFRECKVVHDVDLSKHSNCVHVPFHVPDPSIDWAEIRQRIARDQDFPYEKTE